MAFNPNEHLTGLPRQQKRKDGTYETVNDDYLEVKWRLVWFREQCPKGSIVTEEVFVDLDREVSAEATRWVDDPKRPGKKMKETYTKTAKGYARYRAIVKDGNGAEATGTKTESAVDFPDFCEKAETGAIGRALAALGFGTQFTGDEFNEKHRIVDSPVRNDAEQDDKPAQPETNAKPAQQPVAASNAKAANDETFMPVGAVEDALNNMYKRCMEMAGVEKGPQLYAHIRSTIVGEKRDVSIVNDDLIPMWSMVHEYEEKYKAARERKAKQTAKAS